MVDTFPVADIPAPDRADNQPVEHREVDTLRQPLADTVVDTLPGGKVADTRPVPVDTAVGTLPADTAAGTLRCSGTNTHHPRSVDTHYC